VLFAALVFGSPRVVVAKPPSAALVHGFVRTGDASGIWTLYRCGDALEVPIRDSTPGDSLTVAVAEVKRAMQDSRRGVFVEFQGTVARGDVVAKRLWRVLGYVADCAKTPGNVAADAMLWATGNDPDWRLVVSRKLATLTRFGHERLAFPAAALMPRVNWQGYEAQSGSTRLTIEVDEELCLDPMAETAYGARITATLLEKGKTQKLSGCAARF
jgi:uncharacterized membrane protein